MQELSIDYSQCRSKAGNTSESEPKYTTIPSEYVSHSFKGSTPNCTKTVNYEWTGFNIKKDIGKDVEPLDTFVCSLQFRIPDNLKPPVLLYYRLTNFYQNHRRYVKSLDSDQLKGTAKGNNSLGACDPLDTDKKGRPYYPCGLIANSVFNDTFHVPLQLNVKNSNAPNRTYNMTNRGIAWASDAELYGETKYKLDEIAVPPNWALQYPDGRYTEKFPPPNLKEREDIQVWMRTAGLPNFSKLAMRNDNETMECSTYQVDIEDRE